MEKIYIWIIALMVLSALVTIIKPRIKGKMGEATVSMLLKKLDKNKYQVVNDVLLSAEGGNTRTTQIDHVVVSIYGIFSIETKNYKGQIYGSESSAKWTQNIYGHKYSFMNPIYQNYAHVKALNALLQSHGYGFLNCDFSRGCCAKNKDNKIAGCEVGSSYKDGQKTFCPIGSFERGYG